MLMNMYIRVQIVNKMSILLHGVWVLFSEYFELVFLLNCFVQAFHSQDLISNSPYCLQYNSSKVSLQNFALEELTIPKLLFFFILITCVLDIV